MEINAAYVRKRLHDVAEDEDLSKFILSGRNAPAAEQRQCSSLAA